MLFIFKESLLEHIGSIDEHTETVIVVQLCLALADLVKTLKKKFHFFIL